MSLAWQAGTAAGMVAAVGAAVSLWWGAEQYDGPLRRGYRWFAVAAALWGIGVIAGHELAVPAGAAAVPLSFGDLPSLLALPVIAAGFARLAAAGSRAAAAEPAAAGRPPPSRLPGSAPGSAPSAAWPTGTSWPPRSS